MPALRYQVLMPTSGTNPMRLLYVIGAVSVVTCLVSCHGAVLSNKLAAMGGELGGGELGPFAKFFGIVSSGISLVLMISVAATIYTAVLNPIQKVVSDSVLFIGILVNSSLIEGIIDTVY